ncbi:Vitellogenin [Araneus ventricosus]|uniref:Vitellogenin n=1 Tax=Araneus ventricosus TaxID=182803 RepID=A0A4Y2CK53_ARAVE|nr:Vitellogenin [Araneus ventricosus]
MGLRLLALACLAGAAFAASNPKFGWKVGKADVYHFKSRNNITYIGRQTQTSSVEGTLEYHTISPCQAVLKMRNIRIDQKLTSEEKEDLKKKLEIPLPFTRNDGVVEHICPSPEESTQSLNIKKAMISSFINSMSNLDTPEETETPIRSSLIFEKSSLVCTQHIEDQIVKRCECNEKERMKPPIKEKNSWFELSSTFQITFLEKKPAEHFVFKENRPQEELLYGIEETRKGDSSGKDVEKILRKICPKNIHVVDISVSSDFIKLSQLAKSLSYEELDRIYESLKYGKICSSKKVKDLFVDTLPIIGTEAAVKVMVKLIENHDVTGLKAKLWPASLALIQKPTKAMISATVPLVKSYYSPPMMLGVSAMIYRICSKEHCKGVNPVNQVVSVFNEYIGENCSSDDDDKTLSALKAFGNMGYHGKAHKNIIACIQDNSKSNRLRLAAIDSFRRMNEKRPDEFIKLYSNKDEDYEIRIALFDSACKHADHEQFQKMKETAESETDPQVGAYVSSYIKNMKKTTSPMKEKAKKLLQNLEIQPPKFNYWENSKNIEVSGFSKSLNIGGGIEANIIHSLDSKIPRSVSTLFHVDVFDKHLNLFEFGLRAESLEKIIEKIIGLKDSLPKEQSWDLFSSKHLWGDTDAAMSFFVRLLDTEIFDLSGSDLSGIGEMIRIAEMMNTLAQGKNADFSHSFVFMNSKLVVPSVTGRSYSIDFTGSSTVGVTARSKADILSFPRNTDVHFHFQPSVNVEISTTVGIQSNKHRPDVKVSSRLHLESDLEAKFHVKGGHVAIASLTLPSENIMMAKLSTDVINIDEDHNENRIYKEMQKKVDYCFTKLHKPLGISACATVEVPKPMVTRSFPYVMPFGNGEFTLKKSDHSFSSYEMRLEIPKHSGPQMKYKASLDTPGSKISRRFAADLNVKRHTDHREFSFEFITPFKTAGASGSFTRNDKLIQGILEIHSGSEQILSANVTSKILSSRSRMIYQTSAVASFRDYGPVKTEGSFTAVKGRKRQVNFDLKMSKPDSKPITITGSIKQEGRIELSSKSEWKLSTEFSLNSPIGDMKIRSTCDKKSKQPQAISANLGIDYKKIGGKEHSAALSGTSQMSSRKINTNAKFETTEYPKANWYLNWDLQRESEDGIRNDVALKYGKDPEKNYINLKQVSRVPQLGRGENTASVEISQLNISYEVSVKHHLEISATSKFQIDADIRYNQAKHVKGLIDVNYQSKGPLKATGKFELEHNGVHYVYEDEILERNDKLIEGKSKFQYEEGKVIQLKYNYKRLSDDSKFHHEIESSLQTPSSPSPIESKVSLRMSSESFAFAGHFGSNYSIQAHSNQVTTHVHVKHPSLEGKLKVNNEVEKTKISLDMRIKGENPRHAIGSLVMEKSENKSGFQLEIIPDIDNKTESKILAYTKLEILNSGKAYSSSSKLQIFELVTISLNETGDLSVFGDQACTFEYIAEGLNPIKFQFKRKTGNETAKTLMIISVEDIDVAKMQLDARWKENANKHELSVNGSITSPYRSLDNIDVYLFQQATRLGPSTTIQSHLIFKKNEKVYKAEWHSDLQPNGVELKAAMQTPHENYEKQALGISIQRATNGISSSMNIEVPNSKVISISTEVKKKNHVLSAYVNVNTPIEEMKDIVVELIVDNHRSKKSLKSHVDVNNARIVDIEASFKSSSIEKEAEGRVKFSNMPEFKYQGFRIKFRSTKSSISALGNVQLTKNKELSFASEIKEEGDIISTTTKISTPHKNLKDCKIHLSVENKPSKRGLVCYIDANGERKGDAELSISSSSQDIEIKARLKTARTPEISAHAKCEKTGESLAIFANIFKDKSPLFSTSFNRLSNSRGEKLSMKTRSFEKTILDLEASKEESRDNSKKFSFKVSGEFPAVSVTFSKNHTDPTSISTELRVCQEAHQTECYNLKSYHKNVLNSDNHRFYQKFTMDLEKSVGGSYAEAVGSLHIVVNQDEYDSGSKLILQSKDQKIGYEMKFHKRQHQDDHHSFDTYIFLRQRTSRLKALILQNSHRVKLELDAIPNTEDPTRKFGIDMRRDINRESKEISGYIKMEHPTRSEPLLFTCKLEQVDEMFVKGKMLLHYSTTYGKTLIFELDPNLEQEQYGIRSMVYKLYTQDKSLDAHLKLIKQKSRQEDKIGYEWKYTSSGDEKRGGVIATFYDKKSGKPKSIKIKYYSPSNDYEVLGSIAQAPQDASVSLVSRGQKMKELRIKTSDSCLNIEVHHSGPLMKSSLCVNKREGDTVQLVKADIYCRQQKCLDARLYLDPQKPEFVSVAMKWEKKDILRSLRKATGYDDIFQGRPLSRIIRELKDKLALARRDILSSIQEKFRRGIKRIEEEISRKVKRMSKWHSEVLDEHMQSSIPFARSFFKFIINLLPLDYITQQVIKPLREATECFFHEYVTLIWEHIPKFIQLVMDVTRTQFEHCLKKFCVQGTFCYDFFQAYQQHGILAAQDLVHRQISRVKEYLNFKFPSITIADLIKFIHSQIALVKKEIETVFGKIVGDTIISKIADYGKKIENRLRQKVIDTLDKIFDHINNIFSGDEDYRIAKSLASDAKRKIKNIWRNREEIAKRSLQAVKDDIKENAKKLIQEQIQVEKFDTKEGDVRFSFRQPLGAAEVQILKNELRTINRKLEDYLIN